MDRQMNALRHVVLLATLAAVSITNLMAADHATGNATIVGASWSSGTYTYDGSGNVTQIGDDVYRYDEYGRLARATVGPPITPAATTTQQFTYDSYGNLTTIITTSPSGTRTGGFAVNAATNQLTGNCPAGSDPCFSAFYDAGSGNQLGRTTANEYKWDPAGMMSELNQPAVRHERYIYDANDERIVVIDQPSSSSETRRYALRGLDSKVARELTNTVSSNTWELTKDYVYRGSVLLASFSGNETDPSRHYHIDHLGSPRLITDGTAHRLAAHTYLPFGREAEGSEADTERMKFTGHERDGVAGSAGFDLDYMHARYYDPNAGRFLSVDPELGSAIPERPQTWNRYSYVANNPVNALDPTGTTLVSVTGQNTLLDIAGNAAPNVAFRQDGSIDTINFTQQDLANNEGALLLREMDISKNMYSYEEGTTAPSRGGPQKVSGVLNLDEHPVDLILPGGAAMPKGPGRFPVKGVNGAVTVDPATQFLDAGTRKMKIPTNAIAFHELAEVYAKVEHNLLRGPDNGPGAHLVARLREVILMLQRPSWTPYPAGGTLTR
ncbi:MAG: hypothetical protein JWO97_4139 [Acidobacteria bacterium]|nr:hypothetical protein [Acidobacteriota bacterium]